MLREIISRCKTIKYCADNFTQDFGLDLGINRRKRMRKIIHGENYNKIFKIF